MYSVLGQFYFYNPVLQITASNTLCTKCQSLTCEFPVSIYMFLSVNIYPVRSAQRSVWHLWDWHLCG